MIQEQPQTTSLKKEQMLDNASSSGISWAHIIKVQGGYFGKNRMKRWENVISENKIVSGNFLITHHNFMFES
jgi:hypothetical protein